MTCTWEPDEVTLSAEFKALDVAVRERALLLATSTLQMLTNYRVGLCPETIRPCPTATPCRHPWEPMYFAQDQAWLNACGCRTARWCAPLSEIDLPGPVGFVDSIKVDGALLDLDTGDWRLDDGHLLVWQGVGPSPVPSTQNLDRPDTAPGTWSVTYSRSYAVNEEGRIAVAHLAMEYAKALTPSKNRCKLPKGVTSVVRAGVSFSVDQGLFQGGLTGVDVVDSYILKWAPAGSPTRTATVFDPGAPRARVTSGLPVRVSRPSGFGQSGFGQ